MFYRKRQAQYTVFMSIDSVTPEKIHAELLRVHEASLDVSDILCVDALSKWLLEVDRSFKPPLVSLVEVVSGIGFILDGSTIQIQNPEKSSEFFNKSETETEALRYLNKLFGS